jgi:hypothetical protein
MLRNQALTSIYTGNTEGNGNLILQNKFNGSVMETRAFESQISCRFLQLMSGELLLNSVMQP